MTAAGLPEPGGAPLSIGSVLDALRAEFPEITISKIRFLESEGLISPARTPAGYRQFSHDAVVRLRFVLSAQRDHYLPLHVIREYLEDIDAGRDPVAPGAPPSIVPAPRRYRREELLATAGAAPQLLNDAISTGVLAGADAYTEQQVALLRALVALDRHGIEPRHVRALRQSAERDVALVESALAPLLRRTDAASRGRAGELAPELAKRLDEVRGIFVRTAIERLLS